MIPTSPLPRLRPGRPSWRRFAGMTAIAAAMLPAVVPLASAEPLPGWDSEVALAREAALRGELPLVVLFVQEGCDDCADMKATLRSPRSRGMFASGRRSLVTIQEHPETVREFGIQRTPTLVVLKPGADGMREVFRQEGSMSPGQLARVDRSVRSIAAIAHPPPPPAPAEPTKPWGWSLRGTATAETTATATTAVADTVTTDSPGSGSAVAPDATTAEESPATPGDNTPTTR